MQSWVGGQTLLSVVSLDVGEGQGHTNLRVTNQLGTKGVSAEEVLLVGSAQTGHTLSLSLSNPSTRFGGFHN